MSERDRRRLKRHDRESDAGNAPGPLMQFWWDLLPRRAPDWLVPPQSGLQPPKAQLDWITREIADFPDALDQTRRAHALERERAVSLEAKASTMASLCLTLTATALAVGGYELQYVRRGHGGAWWCTIPAAFSVVFLALAVISALEVQRVGIYQWEGAEPLARPPGGLLGLVQSEEVGRQFAAWTALTKANGFLQARAWLSRALVCLILSALVAIGIATRPGRASPRPARVTSPGPTPTTAAPRPAPSTTTPKTR